MEEMHKRHVYFLKNRPVLSRGVSETKKTEALEPW